MDDYKDLGAVIPGNPYYNINARNYIESWKKYWSEYIPAMIKTKSVPDAVPWGKYPELSASVTSTASEVNNTLVRSFTPAALKGIIFLTSDNMVSADQGANFGPELTALANSWKKRFGSEETPFYYTIPNKSLAPKITSPTTINGKQSSIELSDWTNPQEIQKLIEIITKDAAN
jgi:hypothetical protein